MKLRWLFIAIFTGLVAKHGFSQNSAPILYVQTAPSGLCQFIPQIEVLTSSGAIYTCDNGTWTSQASSGSGTVSSGTAGQSVYYGVSGTTVIGIPPYAADITAAPGAAACDGSTDDHVAIQAKLDANFAIYIPNGAGPCNLGTVGLTLGNALSYNAIYGNGGAFFYAGTGVAISFANPGLVRDLAIFQTGGSNSATSFSISGGQELFNVSDTGLPAGSASLVTSGGAVYDSTFGGGLSSEGSVGTSATIVNTAFGDASDIAANNGDVFVNGSFTSQSATSPLTIAGGAGSSVSFAGTVLNGQGGVALTITSFNDTNVSGNIILLNDGDFITGTAPGLLSVNTNNAGTQNLVSKTYTENATSTAPAVSSNAGTGSLTHGTDNAGIIATGTASTATTLTFGVAWGTWASCTVSASTSTALPYVSAISKTAVTFTYVTTGTPALYYSCNGY